MKKFVKIGSTCALGLVGVLVATSCGTKKGDFQMWTGFGSTYSMWIQKLIDYEADKNQIKIDYTTKGSYDNLQKAINESIPTLDYPTIANGYPDHFAGYIRAQAMMPLNTLIADYDKEHGTNLMEDYYSDYMKENMSLAYLQDGTPAIMGLPFNKSTELLGYNGYFLDYAKSLNVVTELPKTWQQWAEQGPKLRELQLNMCGKVLHGSKNEEGTASNFTLNTNKEGDDVLMDMSEVKPETSRLMSWDASDNMFITVVRQWGSTYTSYSEEDSKMQDPHGWVEFNNDGYREKTIEALKFFDGLFGDKKTLSDTYTPDYKTQIFGLPANFGGLYSSDAFKANQVMFTVCSSGGLSYNTSTQRFRIAPIPYFDDGNVQRKFVISQGTNLALFDQGSKETLKKAFDCIIDFTTGDLQAQWACDTGYFPASKSASNSQIYKDMINNKDYSQPNIVAYRESMKINEDEYMNEKTNWVKFVDPGFVGSSDIRSTVKNVLANVFNQVGVEGSTKTYEDVLNETYSNLKKFVHNYNWPK